MTDATVQAQKLKDEGNALFKAGKYSEAAKLYTDAMKVQESHILYSNRSAAHARMGNFPSALNDARKAIELKPDWSKGYLRKGMALALSRDFDEAAKAYEAGLKVDPENQQLKNGAQQVRVGIMGKKIRRGAWAMMFVPYNTQKPNGILWDVVDSITDWFINQGCSGIVALSHASEMHRLSPEERIQLVKRVVDRVNGALPVIAVGTVSESMSTQNHADFIKKLYDVGVSAVLLTPVALMKSTTTHSVVTLRNNLSELLALTGDIPLGFYEAPLPSKFSISDEMFVYLLTLGKFVMFVDGSGKVSHIANRMANLAMYPGTHYFIGNTTALLDGLKLGAHGYIGNAACFFPKLYAGLCAHYNTQKDGAQLLHRFLSLSTMTVDHLFPLNLKVYHKLYTDVEGVEPVTRIQMKVQPTEEDVQRLGHLREAVAFVAESTKDFDKKKTKTAQTPRKGVLL